MRTGTTYGGRSSPSHQVSRIDAIRFFLVAIFVAALSTVAWAHECGAPFWDLRLTSVAEDRDTGSAGRRENVGWLEEGTLTQQGDWAELHVLINDGDTGAENYGLTLTRVSR